MPSPADTALDLYDRGLNVFPVLPGRDQTDCQQTIVNIARRGRMRREQVREAFSGYCDVGVMTGHTSCGLIVIRANEERYENLLSIAKHEAIPVWAFETKQGGELWVGIYTMARTRQIDLGLRVLAHTFYRKKPGAIMQDSLDEYIVVQPAFLCGQFDTYKLPSLDYTHLRKLDITNALLLYPIKRQHMKEQVEENILAGQPQYVIDLLIKGLEQNRTEEEIYDAIAIIASNYKSRARKRIRHYAGFSAYLAEYYPWSGKEGLSDLAVCAGLIRIAASKKQNKTWFTATILQIALEAHLKRDTVAASIQRLVDYGILRQYKKGMEAEWVYYKFNPSYVRKGKSLLKKWGANGHRSYSCIYSTLTHDSYQFVLKMYPDLLEKGALEYPGLLIHALIAQSETGMTKKAIAEQLHLSPDTIKSQCQRLLELGMLTRGARWHYHAVPLTNTLAKQVINTAGVAGQTDKKRKDAVEKAQRYTGLKIIWHRHHCDHENMDTPV